MNAADVLAEARLNWAGDTTGRGQEAAAKYQLAALLAHGEQGVAITGDQKLWKLVAITERVRDVDGKWITDAYRLVAVDECEVARRG
jgi:hypothetical protein